jgi:hypothetical protein
MNGIFGLSKREAEVYSFIMQLDTEWVKRSAKDYKDVLSTSNRRLIISECNIGKTNLSRLIILLREKGLLVMNADGGYEVPSAIAIPHGSRSVEVVFTLNVDYGTGSGQGN